MDSQRWIFHLACQRKHTPTGRELIPLLTLRLFSSGLPIMTLLALPMVTQTKESSILMFCIVINLYPPSRKRADFPSYLRVCLKNVIERLAEYMGV